MNTLTPEQMPAGPDPVTAAGGGRLVIGGGCFWCTEAVFSAVDGVLQVTPGYAGGAADTAQYRLVCGGQTGHAEVIEVLFDPLQVGADTLFQIFFSVAHDPTQLNRQGNDRGTQYRSVVFAVDGAQAACVREYIATLDASGLYDAPVVTEVAPLTAFYPAEREHFDYARQHPGQPYIQCVSAPKVAALAALWPDRYRRDA